MKKKIKLLLILLFAILLSSVHLFAQTKRISANGVTIPEWMLNCKIIQSEYAFNGQRTIGQVLAYPSEKVKLNEALTLNVKLQSVVI